MQLKLTHDHKRVRVDEEFTLGGVTVTKGFWSDGGTVPRLFWIFFPPMGKFLAAYLVHDFCIEYYGYDKARDAFKLALTELGFTGRSAAALYNAVRLKDWYYRQLKIKAEVTKVGD